MVGIPGHRWNERAEHKRILYQSLLALLDKTAARIP